MLQNLPQTSFRIRVLRTAIQWAKHQHCGKVAWTFDLHCSKPVETKSTRWKRLFTTSVSRIIVNTYNVEERKTSMSQCVWPWPSPWSMALEENRFLIKRAIDRMYSVQCFQDIAGLQKQSAHGDFASQFQYALLNRNIEARHWLGNQSVSIYMWVAAAICSMRDK